MKLKEVVVLWAQEKKRQVKSSTFNAYALSIKTKILPYFGEMDVTEIDKIAVKKFVSEQLENNSPKTVKDMLIVLKMLINYASEECEIIGLSTKWKIVWPTVNLSVNKIERYSIQQVKQIAEYCQENPSPTTLGVLLALTTGMRIGELCALQFSDVDMERNVIKVSKTLGRTYNVEMFGESKRETKTKIEIGRPKTISSNREIPITGKVRKLIKNYVAVSKPEYYLCSGKKTCCEPRLFRERAKAVLKAAGIETPLKFHAFRHTFATTLIENRTDVKTVSAILGHSDVSITLNLYVHPSDSAKANAISKTFNGLL